MSRYDIHLKLYKFPFAAAERNIAATYQRDSQLKLVCLDIITPPLCGIFSTAGALFGKFVYSRTHPDLPNNPRNRHRHERYLPTDIPASVAKM